MVPEARIEAVEGGRIATTPGWYVINAAEARWHANDRFGAFCNFEGTERFEQLGVNIHVVWPGQASCMYHRETEQENFLVLAGECLLLVEEQERRLRAWDFVHCPPQTSHVFVGAGDGPCAILMLGRRSKDSAIVYPVSELALRHGAGVAKETPVPKEAYADCPRWRPAPGPIEILPRS